MEVNMESKVMEVDGSTMILLFKKQVHFSVNQPWTFSGSEAGNGQKPRKNFYPWHILA